MIIYRPHRGGFAESMAEAREFNSRDEMFRHIVAQHTYPDYGLAFALEDLVLDDRTVDDPRNGWHDTRHVCARRYFSEVYEYPQCVGMCAENYEKKKQLPE